MEEVRKLEWAAGYGPVVTTCKDAARDKYTCCRKQRSQGTGTPDLAREDNQNSEREYSTFKWPCPEKEEDT